MPQSLFPQFPAFIMIVRELAAVLLKPRYPLRACPHSQPNPDRVIEKGSRRDQGLVPGRVTGSLLQEYQVRRQDVNW
jgi:hypothetical protein